MNTYQPHSFSLGAAEHDNDDHDKDDDFPANLDETEDWVGQIDDDEETQDSTAASPSTLLIAKAHLTKSDLEGLPEELMKELGLSESDRKEMLIVELIDKAGGISSINKILVDIYHASGEVEKRTSLSGRLNRMQRKGLLFSVAKNKGVYATRPVSVSEESEDVDLID